MKVILLKDLEENNVDAVIITETSTADEVQLYIDRMKKDNDMYDFEDLLNCLPNDCVIYHRWEILEEVYY
jgi:hypothetical protein